MIEIETYENLEGVGGTIVSSLRFSHEYCGVSSTVLLCQELFDFC